PWSAAARMACRQRSRGAARPPRRRHEQPCLPGLPAHGHRARTRPRGFTGTRTRRKARLAVSPQPRRLPPSRSRMNVWKRPQVALYAFVVGLAAHNRVMALLWGAGVRGGWLEVIAAWKEALLAVAVASVAWHAWRVRRLP